MEVHRAISNFTPPPRCQQNTPDDEGVQNENVLAFKKGDHFEVLEKEEDRLEKQWWIARALHAEGEAVGFVPAKYLKPEQKKVTKLLPEDSRSRELNKKALEELKQRSHNPQEQVYPELLIPEPDYYSDEETNSSYNPMSSEDGGHLIQPKKLPNPCLESTDRQQLHRELKLNQKIGRNVLNQKSELKKELEKRQDNASRKHEQEQKRENRSSFEVRMEQQAAKLKMAENAAEMERRRIEEEEKHKPEFVKVKERIKGRTDSLNSDS